MELPKAVVLRSFPWITILSVLLCVTSGGWILLAIGDAQELTEKSREIQELGAVLGQMQSVMRNQGETIRDQQDTIFRQKSLIEDQHYTIDQVSKVWPDQSLSWSTFVDQNGMCVCDIQAKANCGVFQRTQHLVRRFR